MIPNSVLQRLGLAPWASAREMSSRVTELDAGSQAVRALVMLEMFERAFSGAERELIDRTCELVASNQRVLDHLFTDVLKQALQAGWVCAAELPGLLELFHRDRASAVETLCRDWSNPL